MSHRHQTFLFVLLMLGIFTSVAYGVWRIIINQDFEVHVDNATIPYSENQAID